MTLIEHLAELRRRLIIVLVAVTAGAIVIYLVPADPALLPPSLLRRGHLKGTNSALTVFGPLDAFAIRLNITAYGALALALPVIVFQLWRFVTPGLKANEKRYRVALHSTTMAALFVSGLYRLAHLSTCARLPPRRRRAEHQRPVHPVEVPDTDPRPDGDLRGFSPSSLSSSSVSSSRTSSPRNAWRTGENGRSCSSSSLPASVTPSSDPFSMLALAIPMIVFYEASIQIGRIINRGRGRRRH